MIIKSVFLYGSKMWRLTAYLVNTLHVFLNKCLRQILKIRWPETITNEDLWPQAGQGPVELELKYRA